ncbi:MAG TPA: aquaporin [Nitrospira sp.]|nr:aquaporin [Nitrospira sp.]
MRSPVDTLRAHWPEYLMEAAGLGLFMVSASFVTAALEYPHSPLHATIADPLLRRVVIGFAMGLTAIGIIYSPWGKQSGAHLNPAVTLTFFRLGKIEGIDASFYVIAQSLGGLTGVLLSAAAIGMAIEHPAVNYVVTTPGESGTAIAFVAETIISFGLMLTVLLVSNHRALNVFTGVIAGSLVAIYISLEAPLSGMSMNPARTFASAFTAHLWTSFWIYLTAPPLGMLLAAEVYMWRKGLAQVYCAKLHHRNDQRCIFRCNYLGLLQAGKRSRTQD